MTITVVNGLIRVNGRALSRLSHLAVYLAILTAIAYMVR